MCGIAGFWSPGVPASPRIAAAMADTLVHRGPDAGGTWVDPDAGLGFGHRRLAIVELSPAGAQPMMSRDGRWVICFNGEIYNHLEMRRDLQSAGHHDGAWRGGSDTETLVETIAATGVARTLPETVGMFAFAAFDRKERTLWLARDRFGEKPLFVGWGDGHGRPTLLFGSELKALRAHPDFNANVDRAALGQFLRFSYVPAPGSIYCGVRKLMPGSFARLDVSSFSSRSIIETVYWDAAATARKGAETRFTEEGTALGAVNTDLQRAISGQMIADVSVGAFLSGGIDSSTIVALAQAQANAPIRTFTVGFEEAAFNEAPFAARVAKHLGTEHTELTVTTTEALGVIPTLSHMFDEPFGDSSQIPTYLVARSARQEVTVALSGDAGDEVFGGYTRYFIAPNLWNKIKWMPHIGRALAGSALTALPPRGWDWLGATLKIDRQTMHLGDKIHKLGHRLRTVRSLEDLYLSMLMLWPEGRSPALHDDRTAWVEEPNQFARLAGQLSDFETMMLLDTLSYLPDDILAKVDRAAMATSLETRVPMLDHRLFATAARLPLGLRIEGRRGKIALRRLLSRHIPDSLMERPKAGFGIPVGQWMRKGLRGWAEGLLAVGQSDHSDGLNQRVIHQLWQEHLSGQQDWTARLWNILMWRSWLLNETNTKSSPEY